MISVQTDSEAIFLVVDSCSETDATVSIENEIRTGLSGWPKANCLFVSFERAYLGRLSRKLQLRPLRDRKGRVVFCALKRLEMQVTEPFNRRLIRLVGGLIWRFKSYLRGHKFAAMGGKFSRSGINSQFCPFANSAALAEKVSADQESGRLILICITWRGCHITSHVAGERNVLEWWKANALAYSVSSLVARGCLKRW